MNAATTLDRQSSKTATTWKVTLIAIPIVTLALLLWLRQLEVNALRRRMVSVYGSVPEFELINQDGKNSGDRPGSFLSGPRPFQEARQISEDCWSIAPRDRRLSCGHRDFTGGVGKPCNRIDHKQH